MAVSFQKYLSTFSLILRSSLYSKQSYAVPWNFNRFYANKKGVKRKKIPQASFDNYVADGVFDIEKLTCNMETEVDKLRQEYRNCITTRISPDLFQFTYYPLSTIGHLLMACIYASAVKILVVQYEHLAPAIPSYPNQLPLKRGKSFIPGQYNLSAMFDNIKLATGKRKVSLGNIASIQNKDDKYILDLTSSPDMTSPAMKALNQTSIFSPLLEGNRITVTIPRLTMEVRENLVKSAKAVCEEAKIGIRRVRQRGMNDVRKQKKVMSQDDARMVENYIQSMTDNYVQQVDELLREKSKELLQR